MKKIILIVLLINILVLSIYEVNHIYNSSEIVEGESGIITQDLIYNIENKEISKIKFKDVVRINGWLGYKYDEIVGFDKVELMLEGSNETILFSTILNNRDDVKKYFEGENVVSTGFDSIIKVSDLNNQIYRIGVVVHLDNEAFFNLTDYYLSVSDNVAKFVDFKSQEIGNSVTEINSEDNDLLYSIDEIEQNDSLTIRGWAYIANYDSSSSKIDILIENKDGTRNTYTTHEYLREDVVEYFDDINYLKSGFILKLDQYNTKNISRIALIIRNGSVHKSTWINLDENIRKGM